MDISCYVNNNKATISRTREVRYRGRDLGGTWISLEGGNRIDFMGGLGMREWEQEDQVKRRMAEGVEGRSVWRDSWN